MKFLLTEKQNKESKVFFNSMVKWLDHFYGKASLSREDEYFIRIAPIEYYDQDEGKNYIINYKFKFDRRTGDLTYHYDVGKELATFFNVGGLTVGKVIETWFEKKFGYKVNWLGTWS